MGFEATAGFFFWKATFSGPMGFEATAGSVLPFLGEAIQWGSRRLPALYSPSFLEGYI